VSEVHVSVAKGEQIVPAKPIVLDKQIDQAKPLLFKPKSNKYVNAPNLGDLRTHIDTLEKYNTAIGEAYVTIDTTSETAAIWLRTKERSYKSPNEFFQMVIRLSELFKPHEDAKVNVSAQIRSLYFEHGRDFISWLNSQTNVKFEDLESDEWEQER